MTFIATSVRTDLRYAWNFGDGVHAEGSTVHHTFADTLGSDLDDSSRYRVALHVTDPVTNEQSWSTQHLILDRRARKTDTSRTSGGARVDVTEFDIPKDGGYTITLLTSTNASLQIDNSERTVSPEGEASSVWIARQPVQPLRVSAVFKAGRHQARVVRDDSLENADISPSDPPLLLLEGPGIPTTRIPHDKLGDSAQTHPVRFVHSR